MLVLQCGGDVTTAAANVMSALIILLPLDLRCSYFPLYDPIHITAFCLSLGLDCVSQFFV